MCQHIFQPMWFPSLMVRSSWRQSCFTKVSVLLSMWVCLLAEWGLLPKPRPWNRYTDSSHSFLFFFVIIVFVIIIIIIVYIIIIIIITIIIIFVYYYMYHCYYVYFNFNHQGFFRGHEFTKDLWYFTKRLQVGNNLHWMARPFISWLGSQSADYLLCWKTEQTKGIVSANPIIITTKLNIKKHWFYFNLKTFDLC